MCLYEPTGMLSRAGRAPFLPNTSEEYNINLSLILCLQYEISVVGTLPTGSKSPVSNPLELVTAAAG